MMMDNSPHLELASFFSQAFGQRLRAKRLSGAVVTGDSHSMHKRLAAPECSTWPVDGLTMRTDREKRLCWATDHRLDPCA